MTDVSVFPPGWYPDPSRRHVYRWWDGMVWTDRVGDGSVEQHDPVGATPQPHPAPTTEATTWSSPPTRRSTNRWVVALIAFGAVAVVAIGIVVASIVLVASSTTVVSATFDDGTGPFSTDSDSLVALEFADGGYRVTMKDASSPQEARTLFDPARDAVRVEADATIVSSPASSGVGLSCYNGVTGYLFVIGTDGKWILAKVNNQQTGDKTLLGQGTTDVGLGSTTHRLRLDCIGGGTAATTVSASINGTELVTTTDAQGFDQFRAAGFFVGADKAPTVVVFDNLLVTEL